MTETKLRKILKQKEAEAKIKELEEYCGEPVMPVSHYCKALEQWASCIVDLNRNGKSGQGSGYANILHLIKIDIMKSNLLYRLIYMKKPLRTKQCPKHKGRWSGIVWSDPECECAVGGNITGWLPNDEEKK